MTTTSIVTSKPTIIISNTANTTTTTTFSINIIPMITSFSHIPSTITDTNTNITNINTPSKNTTPIYATSSANLGCAVILSTLGSTDMADGKKFEYALGT